MTPENRTARRPDAVTLIAIYHFAVGGLALLVSVAVVLLAALPVLLTVQDVVGLTVALSALGLAAILAGGFGLASIIVGLGLLRLQGWARWAAIVLAVIKLPAFPVGTVIGGLILAYLLGGEQGQAAFEPQE